MPFMFLAVIAQMTAEQVERLRGYLARFRKALRMSGYTDKSAALTMGVSAAQFSRQMSGQERLAHSDTVLLGDEFDRCFAFLTVNDKGLPDDVRRAQSWMPAVTASFIEERGN